DFNTLVSTTLAGFLYVSQLAVKQMLRQQSGSIVNVSTTLVDQPIAGVGAAVQIMLKGALHAVTRALAIEYATQGIRVNTIALGVIGRVPRHVEKEEWRILPVGEVHGQPAALAGGPRRNAPWARVSGKMRGRRSLSPSR